MNKAWNEVVKVVDRYSLTNSDYDLARTRRDYVKDLVQKKSDIKVDSMPMSGSFKKKTAIKYGQKRPDVDILAITAEDTTPIKYRESIIEAVESVQADKVREQTHSVGLKYISNLDVDIVLIKKFNDELYVGDCSTNNWKKTSAKEHNKRIEELNQLYPSTNIRTIIKAARISCKQLKMDVYSFLIDSVLENILGSDIEKTDDFKIFVSLMRELTSGNSHYEKCLEEDYPLPSNREINLICEDILNGKKMAKLNVLFPNETLDLSELEDNDEIFDSVNLYGRNKGLFSVVHFDEK